MRQKLLFILLLFFNSSLGFSYTHTITSSGQEVSWRGSTHLNLLGNPTNRSGISSDDFFSTVTKGLQRWNEGSQKQITFDYWQGTSSEYKTIREYDNYSNIYFASESGDENYLDSSVVGLTEVWFDSETGEIFEVDIVLNDIDYHLTTDSSDTSGYGSNVRSVGDFQDIFLENVITHELGHSFGLGHSGVLQSSMYFLESPQQAHLSCDEIAGVQSIYSQSKELGSISGKVIDSQNQPVFGAHVQAISNYRGVVLASALTNKDGSYKVNGLEPGDYYLTVEPFYADASALSEYYESVYHAQCDGNPFARTFFMDNESSFLKAVKVISGDVTSVQTIQVYCSEEGGANVDSFFGSTDQSLAQEVVNGNSGSFGFIDKADGITDEKYYQFSAIDGELRIAGISYSLFSPVQLHFELLDIHGDEVSVQQANPVFYGDSGYINYDTLLIAKNLEEGNYYLKVSTSPVTFTKYPGGVLSRDLESFFVITGVVNSDFSLTQSFPENARCESEETFSEYSSPEGSPVKSGDDESNSVGFCGTVWKNGPGGFNGGSQSAIATSDIIGWFLPWLLMFTTYLLVCRLDQFQLRLSS